MKNACEKWKDQMLEAALAGTAAKDLEEHLRSCANCSAELDEVRAGATVVLVTLLVVGVTSLRRNGPAIPAGEVAAAQKLAEWRAPSDGLLRTPGQEILKGMPRLGQSYLNVPVKTDEEE